MFGEISNDQLAIDTAPGILTIDLGALAANYRLLRQRVGSARVAGVVKADAYGLGALRVAPTLYAAGCRDFFVAQFSEAQAIRGVIGPEARLYVLNGLQPGAEWACAEAGIIPVLNSLDQVANWSAHARTRGDTLPALLALVKSAPYRFILFCDDLSFDHDDTSYKSLKAALEGGVEGRPDNVVFYATSNRRHLLPRDMIENERSTAINPSEAVEEKVSLSDRFGLWLGFHKCSQDEYLEMVSAYALHYGLADDPSALRADALEWATTRGSRSGRVAWQFVQDLAGRMGRKLGQ